MNTDHIQCYSCEVSCNHCGLAPTLDAMSAVALVDVVRGFLLMHRHCEKPAEPSKQVELFAAKTETERCTHEGIGLPGCDLCDVSLRAKYGIDGNSDEPDPETDPPGPFQMLDRLFPKATTTTELCLALAVVLPTAKYPGNEVIAQWEPGSVVFKGIAHWARVEKAMSAGQERAQRGEPGIPGLYIPTARAPEELVKVLRGSKAKRGARPLSSPKKRRSGSTANSP